MIHPTKPLLLALPLVLLVRPAHAIDPESGPVVGECTWPSVVVLDATSDGCTGVYIGNRTFLTAAHCVSDGTPTTIKFGEDDMTPAFVVSEFQDCRVRDSWDPITNHGVDIAICRLTPTEALPDVPAIQPMVPTGCARDHLAWQVYVEHACPNSNDKGCYDGPDAYVVGMGCESGSCNMSGNKRSFAGKLVEQTKAPNWSDGTTTKLIFNESENSSGPVPGSGVMGGDSGGPLMIQLRDGAWQLIGLLHGGVSPIERYEGVPPYLHWIETIAGDVTPCHDLVDGEWVWMGDCVDAYFLDIDSSYDTWVEECTDVTRCGGLDECGVDDLDVAPPPWLSPAPDGLLVDPTVLDGVYGDILDAARAGEFGRPIDPDALARAFVVAGERDSFHAFLDQETPVDIVELYTYAEVLARRVLEEA